MIYTSGQQLLTRSDLKQIAVPQREDVGKHWVGVPHAELAESIVTHVEALGFRIAKETWYCNPNQTALYGSVDVDTTGTQYGLDLGQDALYSVGVRHDNAGKYAISLAVGARVTVCSNGLFSGDFVVKHRHFGSLDLQSAVQDGMEQWLNQTDEVGRFARLMQGVHLDDKDASYLVANASMEGTKYGCFPWEKAQKVMKAWMNPPHEEFADRTMWSCYNAFTEVAKELSPPKQVRLLKGLKPMMTEFAAKAILN